jgi:Zn-dependent protease
MLQAKYRLCELFGIPIYVNLSFVLLLLIFVTDFHSFSFGLAAAIVLAISVTLHELGHALTAGAFGYRTRDITLSLLGGCASLTSLPRKAWQELLTALAGPLVSFAIAGVVLLLDVFGVRIENNWLRSVLAYTFWMNVMLGGFNLLPGFPMDGGRIFRSVMRAFMSREKATLVAMWVGRAFAIVLGLRGLWSIFNGGGWGFVSIMIAWMIWQEGYREYLQARIESDFRHWTQDDFDARVSPPPYERS